MSRVNKRVKALTSFFVSVCMILLSFVPIAVVDADAATVSYKVQWVICTDSSGSSNAFRYVGSDKYGACTTGHYAHKLYSYAAGTTVQKDENLSYCIQAGMHLGSGDFLNVDDTNLDGGTNTALDWVLTNRVRPNLADYGVKNANRITRAQLKTAIATVMTCGFNGNLNNISNGDKDFWYEATQLIIWELTGGYRSPVDFTCYDYDVYRNTLCTDSNKIGGIYNTIEANAKAYQKVVSFDDHTFTMNKLASTDTLYAEGYRYSTTLTDKNGVLSKFNFTTSDNNILLSKSGNSLMIASKTAKTNGVTFTSKKNVGNLKSGDGYYVCRAGSKQMVVRGTPKVDPPSASFTVKSSNDLNIQIVKVDQYTRQTIPLSGFKFNVYNSGKTQKMKDKSGSDTFTTSDDGIAYIDADWENGNYWVREIAAAGNYGIGTDDIKLVITEAKRSETISVVYPDSERFLKLTVHKKKVSPSAINSSTYNFNSDANLKKSVATWSHQVDFYSGEVPIKSIEYDRGTNYSGVRFYLYAYEDIYNSLGVKKFSKGDLVKGNDANPIITDTNGDVTISGLYPGKYRLVEETSTSEKPRSDGYIPTNKVIDLSEADYESPTETTVYNTKGIFHLSLNKSLVDPSNVLSDEELEAEYRKVSFALVYSGDTIQIGSDFVATGTILDILKCNSYGNVTTSKSYPAGTYIIREMTTSPYFSLDPTWHQFKIDSEGNFKQWLYGESEPSSSTKVSTTRGEYDVVLSFGDSGDTSFKNEGVTLQIQKVDSESSIPLSDAVLKVYRVAENETSATQLFYCRSKNDGYFYLTNSAGVATDTRIPELLPGGKYAFVETLSPNGYKALKGTPYIGSTSDTSSTKNGFRRFDVGIVIDSNNASTVKVTMYGYNDDGSINRSKDQVFSSSVGSLSVKAGIPNTPEYGSYKINKTGTTFSSVSSTSVNAYENNASKSMTLYTPNYSNKNLAGAGFTLYAKSDIIVGKWGWENNLVTTTVKGSNHVIAAGSPLIISGVTDANGQVLTNSSGVANWSGYVPYGTYTCKETKVPTGKVKVADWDVTIDEDHENPSSTKNNDSGKVNIKVRKGIPNSSTVGASESDVKNALKQVYFGVFTNQVFNAESGSIPKDSLVLWGHADESGNLNFSNKKLPKGNYYVKELKCPNTLAFNENKTTFTIAETATTQEFEFDFDNPLYFDLPVVKNGDHWLTATNKDVTYSAGGTATTVKTYYPKFESHALSGVQLKLVAAEDIYIDTAKKVKKYSNGQEVATGTTNANGEYTFKNLLAGKYKIGEVSVPAPYDASKGINDTFTVGKTTKKTYNNTTGKVSVEVIKKMSDADFLEYANMTESDKAKAFEKVKSIMSSLRFALYTVNDIKDQSGTVIIPKNSCLGVRGPTVTGTNCSNIQGTMNWNNIDLPIGSYVIKEVYAPFGIAKAADQTFDVTRNDLAASKSFSFTVNNLVDWKLTPKKVSSRNNKPLGGATVQFYSADKTTMLWEGTSRDSDGLFVSTGRGEMGIASGTVLQNIKIYPGTYSYKETKAPNNFKLDSGWKSVTVNNKNFTLTIKNEPDTGSIKVSKVGSVFTGVTKTNVNTKNGTRSVSTPKYETIALPGATFKIKAAEDIKAVDDPNTVVLQAGKWVQKDGKDWAITTGSDGIANFTGLEFGKYTIVETASPAGYKKVADKTVEISRTAKDVSQTLTDPNNPVYASVSKVMDIRSSTDAVIPNIRKKVESAINDVEFTLYAGKYDGNKYSGDIKGTIGTNPPKIPAGTPISVKTCTAVNPIPNDIKTREGTAFEVVGYGVLEFTTPTGAKLDLPPGDYTVVETNVPSMFTGADYYTFTVSAGDGESTVKTYNFYRKNIVVPDKVKLTKVDAETGEIIPGAGILFGYVDPVTGKDVEVARGITDYTGYAKIRNDAPMNAPWENYEIEVLPGTYFYEEFKAPTGYEKDTKRYTTNISEENNGNRTIECEIKDTPMKGSLEVFKKGDLFADAIVEDDGSTTPVFEEGYLAGAEFTVYANKDIVTGDGTVRHKKGSVVKKLVTDANGSAKATGLYLGEYRIEETKAPEGYGITFAPKVITLTDSKVKEELVATDSKNTVSIKANKVMEEDSYEQINPQDEITKVKFGIFTDENINFKLNKDNRSYSNEKYIPKDTLMEAVYADVNGELIFTKDLPVGKYYAVELETSEKYVLDNTKHKFSITVNTGKTLDLTADKEYQNRPTTASLSFRKIANDTKQPLSGVVIEIRTSNNVLVAKGITSNDGTLLAMNESGNAVEPNVPVVVDDLVVGKYFYQEISTVSGYKLDTSKHTFEVTPDMKDGSVIDLVFENKIITGGLEIFKKGDMFTSVDTDTDGRLVFNYINEYLRGAEFEITAVGDIVTADKTKRYSDGEVVTTLVTNKSGKAEYEGLYYGTYRIAETKAPYGYSITFEPKEFTIGDDLLEAEFNVDNERNKVILKAKKELEQDEYGKIDTKAEIKKVVYGLFADEDIEFAATSDVAVRKDTLIEKVGCDEEGNISFKSDLPNGKYYVVELETSEKYVLDDTKHHFRVDNGKSHTMDLTKESWQDNTPDEPEKETSDTPEKETSDTPDTPWKNNLKRYPLRLRKIAADTGKPLEGALIEIYVKDGILIYKGYTDKNGYIIDCELMLPAGIYTYVEVQQPGGYILDSTVREFTLTGNEPEDYVVDLIIENQILMGNISINKFGKVFATVDNSNEITYSPKYYDSNLSNAKFGIYADGDIITPDGTLRYSDGDLVDTLITDENGNATSKDLYLGTYTVKEIEAPYGYDLSDKVLHVILSDAEVHFDLTYSNDKHVIKAILHKDMELDKNELIDAKKEIFEVSFGLFSKNELVAKDGTTIPADGLIEKQYCNADGNIAFEVELPDGDYYVKELTTSKYYDLDKNTYEFNVTSEKSKTINLNDSYTFVNDLTMRTVKLMKVDASTNKPVAGATVEVVAENGKVVYRGTSGVDGLFPAPETNDVPTETSDVPTGASGYIFPELPIGTYTYYEVEAPIGYYRDTNIYSFNITGDEADDYVFELVIKNENVTGSISITKVGERFVSVETSDEPDATYYKPNYYDGSLDGAIFEVFAAEDIVTPDGTIRVLKGDSVGTMTTDSFGTAKISNLYLGTYVVKEIEAPNGYILTDKGYTVSIDAFAPDVELEPISNERHKVTIKFKKVMNVDSWGILNPDSEIQKVSFGLFASEDIYADDGSFIPKDGLIEKGVLYEGGMFFFKEYLPYGKYYVKELTTSDYYILSNEKYDFEVSESSKNVIDLSESYSFINDWNSTEVTLKKVAEGTDQPIEGAKIEVYYIDGDTRRLIYTGVSDKNGYLSDSLELPIGSYMYKEIEAPYGYNLNDNEFGFTVTGTEKVINLVLGNKKSTGSIQITKKDIVTDDTLPNCVIRLYSEDGSLLIERVTDENGIVVFDELPFGKYYYQEFEAPEGYIIDTNKYPFEISEDGQIIKAVMTNRLATGTLEISKRDIVTDESLPNCTIRIYLEDGTLYLERTTDENGIATFPELPVGKYYYQEYGAPVGYELDINKYPFEIKEDGEIVQCIMKDRKIPVSPETPTVPETPVTVETPDIPKTPTTPTTPSTPGTPGEYTTPNVPTTPSTSVKTGDDSYVGLFGIMLLLSALVLMITRKHEEDKD